jgi:predicted ATP-grasp superfamily ATP-dependent carboligase
MMLIHSEQELLERCREIEDPSAANVMLQEYIPGNDEMTWTFNGYFDQKSDCLVAFSGRKLRNFPPYFGQASLAMCMRNEFVENATIHLMRSIGYAGPLDIGFRFDTRDGRYKVNDINPRIGAMFRVFAGQNGIDVIRVDPLSAFRYYREGNLTLRNWINSLRGVQETAFFARDDPLPLIGAYIMDIRQILNQRRQSQNAPGARETAHDRMMPNTNGKAAIATGAAATAETDEHASVSNRGWSSQ